MSVDGHETEDGVIVTDIDSGDEVVSSEDNDDSDSSISAKELERQQIQSQIDEYLQKGGQITQVDSSVMTDPPKRPESNYGGQPI